MSEQGLSSPWISMWIRPRETMRAIVATSPTRGLPLLYWSYGTWIALQIAQRGSLGDSVSLAGLFGVAAVLGLFIGWVGLNIGSALLYWIGTWMGGSASFTAVRAALVWSNVTSIVNLLTFIGLSFYFGQVFMKARFVETVWTGAPLGVLVIASVIQMTCTVWFLVMLIKSLSEVQQFSAWKALFNIIIPMIILAVLASTLVFI